MRPDQDLSCMSLFGPKMPLQEPGNRKCVNFQEKSSAGSDDPQDFSEHCSGIPDMVQGVAANGHIHALISQGDTLASPNQVGDRLAEHVDPIVKYLRALQAERRQRIHADPDREFRQKSNHSHSETSDSYLKGRPGWVGQQSPQA
jgi:hypothetical protein